MKPTKKEILESLKPIIEKAYPLMQQHGLKDITAYYNGNFDNFRGVAKFTLESSQVGVITDYLRNGISEKIARVISDFIAKYDPNGFNDLGSRGTLSLNLESDILNIKMEAELNKLLPVVKMNGVSVFDVSIPESKIEAYLNGADILPQKKTKKPTAFK